MFTAAALSSRIFVSEKLCYAVYLSIIKYAIITSLFAISLPYQGLYWLGKRANTPLPLSLLDWYQSLKQKLISEQKIMQDQAVPSYQDFANLLKLAEETWGDNYFNEL
nr:terminus macrodomain insulation protein YfbV [[Haemophilus] ducreyi]